MLSVAGVTPFIAIRQSTFDFQVNNLSHHFFSKEEIKEDTTKFKTYKIICGGLSGFYGIIILYPGDPLRRLI